MATVSWNSAALASSVSSPSSGLSVSTSTSPPLIQENTWSTSSDGPATKPSSDTDMSATTVAIGILLVNGYGN